MHDTSSAEALELFEATFQEAPMGIAHVAPDGTWLRVNRHLCEMLGYPEHELLQLRFQDLTHPDDLGTDVGLVDEMLRGARTGYVLDKRYIRKDGASFWARLSVSLLRRENGEPRCFVSVVENIDAERRTQLALAQAHAQLEHHLQETPLGVIEWDGDFRVRRWAGRAEEIFGYAAEEVLGRHPDEFGLIHEDDLIEAHGAMDELVDGSSSANVGSNRNRRKDGSVVHIVWHNTTIRGGDRFSILSLVNDITEQVEATNALEAERASLEDRVTERTRELEQLVDDLERSNRDLERFAYIASHDLQEPLRMVSSYTRLLADRYGEQLDEMGLQFVEFAVDGAQRMQQLIRDLLAFSRVGREPLRIEALRFGDVMQRTLGALEVLCRESGAQIDVHGENLVLHADTLSLERVLQNLVVNAIKFRGEQTPQLRISCVREAGCFRIDVEDNGVGIPPEHTDRVFEIFRRLNARSGEDGTGIGLAVCRRLVELHRGTIRCEPRAAGGTRFTFTISDALAPAPEQLPEAVA